MTSSILNRLFSNREIKGQRKRNLINSARFFQCPVGGQVNHGRKRFQKVVTAIEY
jgi:hypothetical protein